MKVDFFPTAEFEFAAAADYYEKQLRGLGSEFVLEVERVAAILIEHHLLGEKLDKIHRRIPLRRFPYGIIYRVDEQFIRIVAVAHRRRKPSYWHSRVQER